MEIFDAVVIGAGSGGKPLAGELAEAGKRVAVVEMGLVGGECPYLACIPSKAMLLAGRKYLAARADRQVPDAPDLEAYAAAVAYRDEATHGRDDSAAAEHLTGQGIELIRGRATVRSGRTVEIDTGGGTRTIGWVNLVLATGSAPVVPPVDGLAGSPMWTFDTALSGTELPARLTVLGGGAVGCELAQVYATFGSKVTLVESAHHLLPRENAWLGWKLAKALEPLGVEVRCGTTVTRVEPAGDGATVHTDGGDSWPADRILVAVGKEPRVGGFGLEALGVEPDGPLQVDARCRLVVGGEPLDDVFAIGDVTGLAPYTHTANYHARTVAAHLLGHGVDADHTGIPRVVYTEPAVLAAGITEREAHEAGTAVLTADFNPEATSRAGVERIVQERPKGQSGLQLTADATTGVLVGIAAIGPDADSWAAELALAVRTRTTVHELAQALHAFPSWAEAIHPPARELAEKITIQS